MNWNWFITCMSRVHLGCFRIWFTLSWNWWMWAEQNCGSSFSSSALGILWGCSQQQLGLLRHLHSTAYDMKDPHRRITLFPSSSYSLWFFFSMAGEIALWAAAIICACCDLCDSTLCSCCPVLNTAPVALKQLFTVHKLLSHLSQSYE